MEFFDSHTHIDHVDFDNDREEVILRAKSLGVTRMLTVGPSDGIDSSRRAVAIANSHEGIWASIGIHPHDVEKDFTYDALRALASNEKVVAIGESGLDYFRDWSPFDKQEEHFRLHIELALEIKKPLIIHSREAASQCLKILKSMHADLIGGVFHCYSEDADFAKELASMNFLVSFPGSLTFKNAQALRETASKIPIEQILIETDAPFLSPVPHRGKRCESAYVVETAKCLSQIKGVPLEYIAELTTTNAIRLFGIA